jgi:hypothetical protein
MKVSKLQMFFFVAGKTCQYFSTLTSKFDNKLGSNIKSVSKIEAELFLNDAHLFTRAVSVDSLKKA